MIGKHVSIQATVLLIVVIASLAIRNGGSSAGIGRASPISHASRFGIAGGGGVASLSRGDLITYLNLVKASGAGWLRFDINWSVVQSGGRRSFNWAPFDAVVNAARLRGIRLLGSILYTPWWARPPGTSNLYPPTDLGDYAKFAKTVARHFRGRGIQAYEIWNEPNITFWLPAPDPARYTDMLTLAYGAIKAADPRAAVVSAGLSPYGSYGQSDAQHMNPITFLEKMYAAGAAASMDAVGWHPYNYPWGLGYEAWSAWSQMSETTPSARSVMIANGDGAKKIWLTEFGAPTGAAPLSITEPAQAQFVTDAYATVGRCPWAGPAFLYSFRDRSTDVSNADNAFGIIRYNWAPKPAFWAYKAAAARG